MILSKKILAAVFAALMLFGTAIFVGCSNDSNSPNTGGTQTEGQNPETGGSQDDQNNDEDENNNDDENNDDENNDDENKDDENNDDDNKDDENNDDVNNNDDENKDDDENNDDDPAQTETTISYEFVSENNGANLYLQSGSTKRALTDVANIKNDISGKTATVTIGKTPYYEDVSALIKAINNNSLALSIKLEDSANTKFDGSLEASDTAAFKVAILDKITDKTKLPQLNGGLIASDNKYNLYGTQIDKIIERYYNDGKGSNFSMSFDEEDFYFDAKKKLNDAGRTMYTGDTYNDKDGKFVYDLDINAALRMTGDVKNVRITGVNKTNISKINAKFTNVRVISDLDKIETLDQTSGVVEFVGKAPKKLPRSNYGKIVVKTVDGYSSSNRIDLSGSIHTLDIKAVEDKLDRFDNYKITTGYVGSKYVITDIDNDSYFGNARKVRTTGDENYEKLTNEKFEDAGNSGGTIE